MKPSPADAGASGESHNPEATVARSLATARWLAVAWVLMMGVATALNQMPGALRASNSPSADRALFTAANYSTLTGFAQGFATPEEFGLAPRVVFLLQILSGLFLSLIGGGMLMARLAKSRHSDRRVATTALAMIGFAALAGACSIQSEESLLSATTRGLGGLAGAGTVPGVIRDSSNLWLQLLLLPMSLIGGVGTLAVLEAWRALAHRERMSRHSLTVCAVTAGVYLAGLLMVTPMLSIDSDRTALPRASAVVAAAMGFGATDETISQMKRGADWILMAIAMIGTGAIGATGAIGLAWAATINRALLSKIVFWIGVEGAVLLLSMVLLLQTEPSLPADRAAMLAVGALSNVGLSHSPITITGGGLAILSAVMVVGRLLPLMLIGSWLAIENEERKV